MSKLKFKPGKREEAILRSEDILTSERFLRGQKVNLTAITFDKHG